MFKDLKTKLIAGLLSCACLFAGAGVGVNVANADDGGENTSSVTLGVEGEGGQSRTPVPTSGEGADGYSIEIVAKNLSYSDSIYILYAVDFAGFDESQNEVKMLFWDSLQTEYTVETAGSVKSSKSVVTIGDRECIVFYSGGIAAKEMNDMLYCRAYAYVDGEAVYSAVEKYSVVDYVYEKRTEGGLTSNQTAIFADMLDYGTSAQNLFGHNTDFPANATYYTVTVEGGVLDDGFTWGRYLPGATATLIAPEQNADGELFTCWLDKDGNQISDTATLSVTIRSNKYYVASYEALPEKPDTPELEPTPATAFNYYSPDGSTITISGYVGEYTDIVIPEEINGKVVTSIGGSAFYNCNSLTSVVIPDSVTSIGDWAFRNCSALTSVDIGDSVTSIGSAVFADCGALMSVVIPDGVKSIGYSAFSNCSSLTSVVIGDGVTSVGNNAFYYCRGLTSVVIGDSVVSIGEYAFWNCIGLTSVVIPNSVTSIGNAAFNSCSSLTSVYISSLEAWCNISFGNSDANPLHVAKNLYLNDELVTELIIPDTVTEIKSHAFYYCSSLTSVEIPDSVTSIGDYAFYYCSSLTSVDIGDSVTSISDYTFYYCRNLTSVVIPDSVTSIGDYAFYNCRSTSVDIGDSVTSIGNSAFSMCNLTSVVIPDSVTSIGSNAFHWCSSLTSVVIGDSVTSIGAGAFDRCSSLTSVVIPDSVTSIGAGVFDACYKLTIYCEAESQPDGWDSNWNSSNRPVVWGYGQEPEIPEEPEYSVGLAYSLNRDGAGYTVTGIGECTDTDIIIPATYNGLPVTSIGDDAFENCSKLTSVVIPDGVTTIGYGAFSYCSSLTSVVIGDSVTSIGWYAFRECSSLTGVVIGDSVTSIGGHAFEYCSSLKSVEIPDGVTSIGENAFSSCDKLMSVVISDSVTSIGTYACYKCSSLTRVVIPDSVTSIDSSAFYGCSSLTIYCEAESEPEGWNVYWNPSNRPVVWGYKGA